MSVSSEITRIENAKTALATAISNKGVAVPDGVMLDEMAALVSNISSTYVETTNSAGGLTVTIGGV